LLRFREFVFFEEAIEGFLDDITVFAGCDEDQKYSDQN